MLFWHSLNINAGIYIKNSQKHTGKHCFLVYMYTHTNIFPAQIPQECVRSGEASCTTRFWSSPFSNSSAGVKDTLRTTLHGKGARRFKGPARRLGVQGIPHQRRVFWVLGVKLGALSKVAALQRAKGFALENFLTLDYTD